MLIKNVLLLALLKISILAAAKEFCQNSSKTTNIKNWSKQTLNHQDADRQYKFWNSTLAAGNSKWPSDLAKLRDFYYNIVAKPLENECTILKVPV